MLMTLFITFRTYFPINKHNLIKCQLKNIKIEFVGKQLQINGKLMFSNVMESVLFYSV